MRKSLQMCSQVFIFVHEVRNFAYLCQSPLSAMMSEQKKIKEQFRDYLPYGFVTLIQARLREKFNRTLSRGKISQICNPSHDDWDDDVITIALDLAAEKQRKQQIIRNKAESL